MTVACVRQVAGISQNVQIFSAPTYFGIERSTGQQELLLLVIIYCVYNYYIATVLNQSIRIVMDMWR